jgi:hypothetical protein
VVKPMSDDPSDERLFYQRVANRRLSDEECQQAEALFRAGIEAGRASLQRELEEARAALLSPVQSSGIPESDDRFTCCSVCGTETEEPHSLAACAKNIHDWGDRGWGQAGAMHDELTEAQARIAALESGQYAAAVEALRDDDNESAIHAAIDRRLEDPDVGMRIDWAQGCWSTVMQQEAVQAIIDWLESQAKAPQEASGWSRIGGELDLSQVAPLVVADGPWVDAEKLHVEAPQEAAPCLECPKYLNKCPACHRSKGQSEPCRASETATMRGKRAKPARASSLTRPKCVDAILEGSTIIREDGERLVPMSQVPRDPEPVFKPCRASETATIRGDRITPAKPEK